MLSVAFMPSRGAAPRIIPLAKMPITLREMNPAIVRRRLVPRSPEGVGVRVSSGRDVIGLFLRMAAHHEMLLVAFSLPQHIGSESHLFGSAHDELARNSPAPNSAAPICRSNASGSGASGGASRAVVPGSCDDRTDRSSIFLESCLIVSDRHAMSYSNRSFLLQH